MFCIVAQMLAEVWWSCAPRARAGWSRTVARMRAWSGDRLVMGYINATAEFQRHTNETFGELLWDSVTQCWQWSTMCALRVTKYLGTEWMCEPLSTV